MAMCSRPRRSAFGIMSAKPHKAGRGRFRDLMPVGLSSWIGSIGMSLDQLLLRRRRQELTRSVKGPRDPGLLVSRDYGVHRIIKAALIDIARRYDPSNAFMLELLPICKQVRILNLLNL